MSILDDRDYELAVRSIEVAAEHARLEGEELHAHGFAPVQVAGHPALLWERDGRLHTCDAALTAIGIIPEQKEEG